MYDKRSYLQCSWSYLQCSCVTETASVNILLNIQGNNPIWRHCDSGGVSIIILINIQGNNPIWRHCDSEGVSIIILINIQGNNPICGHCDSEGVSIVTCRQWPMTERAVWCDGQHYQPVIYSPMTCHFVMYYCIDKRVAGLHHKGRPYQNTMLFSDKGKHLRLAHSKFAERMRPPCIVRPFSLFTLRLITWRATSYVQIYSSCVHVLSFSGQKPVNATF